MNYAVAWQFSFYHSGGNFARKKRKFSEIRPMGQPRHSARREAAHRATVSFCPTRSGEAERIPLVDVGLRSRGYTHFVRYDRLPPWLHLLGHPQGVPCAGRVSEGQVGVVFPSYRAKRVYLISPRGSVRFTHPFGVRNEGTPLAPPLAPSVGGR